MQGLTLTNYLKTFMNKGYIDCSNARIEIIKGYFDKYFKIYLPFERFPILELFLPHMGAKFKNGVLIQKLKTKQK